MNSHLITADHLGREAIVYVRQSSDRQVRDHLESRRRQRALYQRAEELGWPKSRIVVLEEQKGRSGNSTHGRNSYQNLLDRVIGQQTGIILAVDIDRWARDNADLQLLVRECVFENVLLSNEQKLFNPKDPDDRMLLGIQAALAEYELSLIRDRTSTCWWNKAHRHEMFTAIPTGFVLSETGLVKHPDRRVRNSIQRLFERFHRFSSVLQLFRWYLKQNEPLPYVAHGDDPLRVQWRQVTYQRLLGILRNPAYAGAYVVGRRETTEVRNERRERVRQRRNVPRARWRVIARDKFEGYITWQQYEQNMAKIEKNRRGGGNGHGESRHGTSLLSGLLRCARCGSSLHTTYHRNFPTYVCHGGARQRERGKLCLSLSGQAVEPLFSEMVLEVVRPAGLQATRQAESQLRQQLQQDRQALVDQLQQLEYEAERARRQYDRVEPEHRLVAEDLERRWNENLQAVSAVRERLQQYDQTHAASEWDDALISWFTENRLEEVWYESTDASMKKQIVDILVKEVIVSLSKTGTEIELCIHWQGGHHTFFSAPRRHRKANQQQEAKQLISLLRKVSDDTSIARVLNRHGIRIPIAGRAASTTWTARSVRTFRDRHAIAAFDPEEKKREGLMTAEEAATQLKISPMSVHRLIAAHVLPAEQSQPGLPAIIRKSDLALPRVQEMTNRILCSLPRPLTENPNQKKLF